MTCLDFQTRLYSDLTNLQLNQKPIAGGMLEKQISHADCVFASVSDATEDYEHTSPSTHSDWK
jgi:hypothetical protein